MQNFQLSIITINYNNDSGLLKTIKSVIAQKSKNFEFLIIDGNSTDTSKKIVDTYKEYVNYYVSEPDAGIYNAMNKGIVRASGKYLLFLNSGDELYDENVLSYIKNPKEDLIFFDAYFYDSTSSFTHSYPYKLNFNYFLKYSLPHQATLINRKLFMNVGLYKENYKICSDWAFFVDAIFKHGASYKKVDKVFAKLDRSGISCDPKNLSWIEEERLNFLEKNYSNKNINYVKENFPTRHKSKNIFKLGLIKLFNYFNR